MTERPAFVMLEDGSWYRGTTRQAGDPSFGEVVFTTSMTGYQETFTDPSYLGQIVVMTAPMIGNYGITDADMESARPQVAGVVVRELAESHSNWRATGGLNEWLAGFGIPVIEGVDTRRLTRHIRERGAMRGLIAGGEEPTADLTGQLMASPTMEGQDLASKAGTREVYREAGPAGGRLRHVVALDFGMKRNIVRMLAQAGCRVTVMPGASTPEAVKAENPDGLFLSNGPGDPATLGYAIENIRTITASGLPTFGICLGHQLLGLAFGGHTVKMSYGHRGTNHPVKDLKRGQVLITSQNHGFALAGSADGVPGAPDVEVTHLNLNDGTVEGVRHRSLPVFAVQYHPEAAPGPHDAFPHFGEFLDLMDR